jgi:biotin transport system substrate-specific component
MPSTPYERRLTARSITTSALLASLLAASALVALPIGVVPFTLQTAVLVLVAVTQRPGRAALTVGTYLAIGAIGLPVFSGLRGGLGVLAGPTGGYLVGFLIGAVAGSWVQGRLFASGRSRVLADVAAALVVIAIVYALGWLQLMFVTGMGALPALLAGVVPFVIPDALKAAGAIALAPMVRRASEMR